MGDKIILLTTVEITKQNTATGMIYVLNEYVLYCMYCVHNNNIMYYILERIINTTHKFIK